MQDDSAKHLFKMRIDIWRGLSAGMGLVGETFSSCPMGEMRNHNDE